MALHRNIYWVGKQWAVTGYGIQACDQKQKGKFDIEAARLWEDGVLERMRAERWLNIGDFDQAIAVARTHYPEPPKIADIDESFRGIVVMPGAQASAAASQAPAQVPVAR